MSATKVGTRTTVATVVVAAMLLVPLVFGASWGQLGAVFGHFGDLIAAVFAMWADPGAPPG